MVGIRYWSRDWSRNREVFRKFPPMQCIGKLHRGNFQFLSRDQYLIPPWYKITKLF